MKVIFSHGKESGPWGFKIKRLALLAEEAGCSVESIDYTGLIDPDSRAERLMTVLRNEQDSVILVGSSMGGYVSLLASAEADVKGVFLLAPALYMPGFKVQEYPSRSSCIEIVHGWSDDIIPVENSIRYARQADCSLHIISGDHPLNSSIKVVESLFQSFLQRIL